MAEQKDNSDKLDLLSLLSASLDLATAAGEIVRSVYATGKLGVRDKALPESDRLTPLLQKANSREAEDPQTIADVQSQKLIVGSLQRAFPRLRIVGEEGDLVIEKEETIVPKLNSLDDHRGKLSAEKNLYNYEDIVVWVDPLDGTKEYTLGVVEAVTVLIGISFKGKALAGVVHVPFRDPAKNPSHTMWGVIGYGAFGFQKSANHEPNRLCLTTSRAHLTGEILRMVEKIAPTKVIHVGGAGYKALLVLEGIADVYFFPQDGTKKWDSCAVEAILEAAGCRLTDSYGDAIVYDPSAPLENTTGIIASSANHHRFLIPRSEQTSSFSAASHVPKPISRV